MLLAIIIATTITSALIYAFGGDYGRTITRRPYNNRYNDAAGAREDSHL
jgi:hypothetical protein